MNKSIMKKFQLVLMLVMVVCLLAGCKENTKNEEVPANTETSSSHYPVTITTYDGEGKEVTTVYEKAPERVLAVYQGSIETMLALGLEDRLVAAAGLDNEVDSSLKTAFDKVNYLDEFTPSKETVISLQPDMILSWGSIFSDKNLGNVDYWISNGCNTYINSNTRKNYTTRTLENEYTDILNLGKIFDVEEKAEEIVNKMKQEISDAEKKAETETEQKTVAVIEFLGDAITNYGQASLAGDMVTSLGAKLVAPEGSNISKEELVSLNPDEIFVVYMAYSGENGEDVKTANLDKVLKDPSFASLSAVKNGNVHAIMLGDMYASGIRTQNGIEAFSEGIYE
ncbi:MAG: ABC transporter substrate-binding protein [bacterium]|nr:ABC transporter substrate-binding protein [bacterium]